MGLLDHMKKIMAAKGAKGRQNVRAKSGIVKFEMMLTIYKEKLETEQDPNKRKILEADILKIEEQIKMLEERKELTE